jgi:thiol-disulfide isomerase/thioredoxin
MTDKETRDIIIELNRHQFKELLQVNPGYVIIKFTATWCKPCARIRQQVEKWFSVLPKEFQCVELDVDENDDIYSFFRKYKIVAGIPAILAYKQGNLSIGPNHSVLGSNISEINRMFETCVKELKLAHSTTGVQITGTKS